MKKMLIKKGSKHPTHPSFRFTGDAFLKKREAYKKADELNEQDKDVRILHIPEQRLIYAKKVRITPRRPAIR